MNLRNTDKYFDRIEDSLCILTPHGHGIILGDMLYNITNGSSSFEAFRFEKIPKTGNCWRNKVLHFRNIDGKHFIVITKRGGFVEYYKNVLESEDVHHNCTSQAGWVAVRPQRLVKNSGCLCSIKAVTKPNMCTTSICFDSIL